MILDINLRQQHKSFEAGFSCKLEGNLVILSGVNGSGKSQLFEILQRRPFQQPQNLIQAQVVLDGIEILPSEVILRSFKENVNIQELSQANPQNLANVHAQVWNLYSQNRLVEGNYELAQQGFADAAHRARLTLIAAFGVARFESGALTLEDIKRGLPPEFAWKQNDSFTNEIGEIFFAFCIRKNAAEAEAGRAGTAVDYRALGNEPWLELNELFSELKLDYRFKTHFELAGIEINEQPQIFHVSGDGTADASRPRSLSELSDGEKAIISLCFASLRGAAPGETKILLLDEFDSTLNPSLTEMFFTVVQRYFVERGILTAIATHSIATLSLAPPCASFYEVYRPAISDDKRILPVERANYSELQKVTRVYQSSVADQQVRFSEIENQNSELLNSVASLELQLRDIQKPMIVTEGPTDVDHLQAASKHLQLDNRLDIQYFDQSVVSGGLSSSKLDRYLEQVALTPNPRRIIGIFDRDEPGIVKKIGDEYFYGNNVYAFCMPIPQFRQARQTICIELLYPDNVIKKECDGKRLFFNNEIATVAARGGERVKPPVHIIAPDPTLEASKTIYDQDVSRIVKDGRQVAHSKSTFAYLIKNDANFRKDVDFSGFRSLFDKVIEILDRVA